MTQFWTVPKGPLVSFGTFNFHAGRSKLHSDWSEQSSEDVVQLVDDTREMDLAGYTQLAIHRVYTWEYLISTAPGGALKDVQDELTGLETMLRTPNGDGTTGQVATLTVALLGYTNLNATATARLVALTSIETGAVYEKVLLRFLCPSGFSYTV